MTFDKMNWTARSASALLTFCFLLAEIGPVRAEADGPDYFRVVGVAGNDTLNVRSAPSATAPKVGGIPHNADGVRILGCQGGLSFAEWQKVTPAEREAASKTRWCRIAFNGVTGWAAGRFLAEGAAPKASQPAGGRNAAAAVDPSFDCTKADSDATKLVCRDAELAALDRETARLYGLALHGPHMTEPRRKELMAMQRGWIKGRDECWKAEDLKDCVVQSYVSRIFELRQGYFDARQKDAEGISRGPLVLACQNFDASIAITFVDTQTPRVNLAWRGRSVALTLVPAGSGAKYAGKAFDGAYTLWTKGDQAMFDTPERQGFMCKIETAG